MQSFGLLIFSDRLVHTRQPARGAASAEVAGTATAVRVAVSVECRCAAGHPGTR